MESRPAHSHLQNRLLLALRQSPATNLAALARELEAQRPSVSRAIHALQAEGMVVKDGDMWRLTPTGEVEALHVLERLPDRAQRTGITVRRLMEQSQLAGAFTEPFIYEMLAPLREVAASTLEPTRALLAEFAAIPKPSTALLAGAEKLAALAVAHDTTAAQVARILAPIDKAETALGAYLRHEEQMLAVVPDTMQSLVAEQDRRFAEIAQSLMASVIDRDQLTSAYQSLLAEGAKLAQFASAYDSVAAQAARSAQDYDSTIARVIQDTGAASTAQLAAARLADLIPPPKLFDVSLPSPAMLDAIKHFTLAPSPAELAAGQFLQAKDTLASSFMDIGSRLAREAVTSFAESQRLNLALIEQATGWEHASAAITRDLDSTNQRLGHILSDLSAVRAQAFSKPAHAMIAAALMPDVAAVARTYRGYLAEVVADLTQRESDVGSMSIALPTRTTASLVRTVRAVVVLEQADTDDMETSGASRPSPWERRAGFVDHVLEQQGSQFSRLWHGSWAVLASDSPDRVRQAAHSGRELLMQLLAALAPDGAFTSDELKQQQVDRPTRKMRVRYILTGRSSTIINHVESIARALDDLYDRLAGISHDRSAAPLTTEHMVACWLTTLGGLLALLLDKGAANTE